MRLPVVCSCGGTWSLWPLFPAFMGWVHLRTTSSEWFCLQGTEVDRQEVFERLVGIHYERNDVGFERGRYRVRGDGFEVWPAYDQLAVRVSMWGDEIEEIVRVDPVTQAVQERV